MRTWVILMVSLSLFPRLLVALDLDVASLAGEDWYGLYLNGQKAGYALNAVAIEADGAVSVTEDAHFRIAMAGIQQAMQIFTKRLYSKEGALLRIEQKVDDPGGAKHFNARVEGESLLLTSTVGGETKTQTLPKPKESLKDALKQAELSGEKAKVGDSMTFSTFEPMYEKDIEGVSTIEAVEKRVLDGVETNVFKIRSTMTAMGIDSVTFVAQGGTTLEDHVASIITMRLEPKEMAQDVHYSNDVIVSNAAPADKPIDRPRERDSLHLRIKGPVGKEHVFNDERQHMTLQEDVVDFVSQRLTLEGFQAAALPITNEDVRPWLKPTMFVQSEDPKMIAKTKEIVGDEKDAFALSTKLCHWVYQNVRTTYSARLSNALEVLEHPEGDCTEHSILFIGLARAAGLPAREAAGLIYVADAKPAFYFHQWATVWVGQWIDVDPTFNQPIADVTHIKLAEGDLFEQAKLIPTIGQLRIEVVDETEKETP